MPLFQYEAINSLGNAVNGTHTAELAMEVEQWLHKQGLSPVDIHIIAGSDAAQQSKPTLRERLQGITIEDRILFCRQISTMLSAGVTVLQALKIMGKQITNPQLAQIILDVSANVEGGESLSNSFSRFPKAFNQLFQNVIKIGEESGNLDNSFSYLAVLYENEKDIRERIKSATRYPKIVVSALFGAVFFLMTFVVPKFILLFAKSKVALPLPTKILISISSLFANHYLLIIGSIILMGVSYRIALNYEGFIIARDTLILKTPVFSNLYIKIYMSRFCRVFAVLTKSGIDIIKTLKLASTALENIILFRMIEDVTDNVEKGMNMHEAMNKHPLLPAMVVQMVAVGEESGQLDTMMDKVADYYEIETDYTIKNLSTLIEPLLLLFMGVMVGFIALAIFMPMWNMMNVMR
ncbi:MAG: type II secretion system F family protein [Proteobacteria bacterium]|nr:type II secretion system F family protein [Pseudomonadota bacterium]MBU1711364.1 type II secretion system F family protein [Pseudomonadota bacterium]